MRAVVQRVNKATLSIDRELFSEISTGLLILLGIEESDENSDAEWLAHKVGHLRIFPDKEGLMNLSVKDIEGEVMVVSQFTLHASTKKGNRPSFIRAAKPVKAIPMYEYFISELEKVIAKPVKTGRFGAMMDILLVNSGPVTIVIDTRNKE